MRTLASLGSLAIFALMAAGFAHAEVASQGAFTATRKCPAFQSIRKGTNPGDVSVEPDKVYSVLAKNREEATHYRVLIEGASPAERWVEANCGRFDANGRAAAPGGSRKGDETGAAASHVLAMGWEPAFCTRHGSKKECAELTSDGFAAKHLSLHGLWPQPRGTQYCSVAKNVQEIDRNHDWENLPEPEMSADTQKRLAAVMPGFQSKLQRHEWIVHGTCFGGNAERYFARAAELAEAIDGSQVSQLFAGHAGKVLQAGEIRAAFDESFGEGAGARVTLSCGGRGENRRITELTINLAGDVTGHAPLGDLMRAAKVVPAGCPGGLVIPAPSP